MTLATAEFTSYHESVPAALEKIEAGFNPVEVDRRAAQLLGLDWQHIPHLLQEI